jgi:hypothetical protein
MRPLYPLLLLVGMLLMHGCTVGRSFIYNLADTKDHRKFPSRQLPASSEPYHYAEAAVQKGPRTITYKDKEEVFEDFLADHRTVAFLVIQHDTVKY